MRNHVEPPAAALFEIEADGGAGGEGPGHWRNFSGMEGKAARVYFGVFGGHVEGGTMRTATLTRAGSDSTLRVGTGGHRGTR